MLPTEWLNTITQGNSKYLLVSLVEYLDSKSV